MLDVLDAQDVKFASLDSVVDTAVDTIQLRDREIERLTEETQEIKDDVREEARAKINLAMRTHRSKVRELEKERTQIKNQLQKMQAFVVEQKDVQTQLLHE